ncbi:MAG: TonB-dependent receptor [Chlorobi bacterium]|nr:TonB-dependent receptor [Chlorobiota bacterium]
MTSRTRKIPIVLLKILFFTSVLSFSGIAVFAQRIKIRDEITHEPVPMANIFCPELKISTFSDAKGEADISEFKNCDSIHIKFVGYSPEIISYKKLKERQFSVYLKQSSISLDETVVSATRWEQNKRDIPNQIATIKTGDIIIQNPQTAADMLGQSGYVYIQKSQLGGGSPMIRGFATNRVLISVDGIRMNNAIFRSGNLQNVISIDPFSIKKTEIIFGPGSIMYGSDAIGGVMSFYTLEPQFATKNELWFKAHATVRFSSADLEKTGHVDFETGLKKWAFATSITATGFDDLKMGKYGPDDYLRNEYAIRQDNRDTVVANPDNRKQVPTGYDQFNIMQKIKFKVNESWILNYDLHYSTTGDYPRYDRLLRYKNEKPKYAEWYYGPQKWLMNHFYAETTKKTKMYDGMVIHTAHQYFRESRHDRKFNSTIRRNRTETVNALNLNIDLKKQISGLSYISYGAEFIFNKIGSKANSSDIMSGITTNAPTRYPDGSTWTSMALFANYKYKLSEKTVLNAGARYNYLILNADFDTTFYHFPFTNAHINTGALTGSLGLVFKPDRNTQLMANLSTGFRAPNIDDVGKVFDSEPGAVVVPNPDLKSEYSLNAEIGLTKVISNRFKLDFSAYYTNLYNAMVRRDYTLNGQDSIIYDGEMSKVQAIQNASSAYVYGLQGGIEWKLPMNLIFTSRLNIMKGEEELDNGDKAPLRHATPVFGTTHITYSHNHLKIDFYSVYNGEVPYSKMPDSERSKDYMYALDNNGNPYAPGWYTLNFKTLYRINDNFIFTAGVENFTNRRYKPFESGIAAPGINYILALKATF